MNQCPRCGYSEPVVGRCWSFFLPLEPPTQNRVAKNSGAMRFAYKKIRDQYVFLVRAAKNAERVPEATGLRKVTFVRLYCKQGKPRDRINNAGGMKPLLDALVAEGLLIDDSEKHCDDYYLQQRTENLSGVEVTIEEVAA